MLLPFAKDVPNGRFPGQHLQYAGCATLDREEATDFTAGLYWDHLHLFCDGLTRDEIRNITDPSPLEGHLLIPCLRNPDLLQLCEVPRHHDKLLQIALASGLDFEIMERLWNLQYSRLIVQPEEGLAYFCQLIPEMSEPVMRWDLSQASALQLTSVGTALAIANIRRRTGEVFDLGGWME